MHEQLNSIIQFTCIITQFYHLSILAVYSLLFLHFQPIHEFQMHIRTYAKTYAHILYEAFNNIQRFPLVKSHFRTRMALLAGGGLLPLQVEGVWLMPPSDWSLNTSIT